MGSGAIHAERREPQTPQGPVALSGIATQLLDEAGQMASGRASRTLTPGAGGALKQTIVALREGRETDEHAPGRPATLQVLVGEVAVTESDGNTTLQAGQWTVLPPRRHGLRAETDAVALVTVAYGRD